MKEVIEGSQAVSEAVRLAKTKVIAAYPITPQSHIIETLSEYCAEKIMDARFITVESEHSAMAAVIGASSTGVRSFTASSSHGLALMHELLHWASGARLPIVMAEVNRALGPGWNIWMDQTDSLAQRDTGWIQLYCEDAQEVFDTTLQAFKLAEMINLPVMVILDAFFLSHTYEPVDIPAQEIVDKFLPEYKPKVQLDTSNPFALGQMTPPEFYMEMRYSIQMAMKKVIGLFENIENDFFEIFERSYGTVEAVQCQDAEIIMVMPGTAASTCRYVIQELRDQNHKVGLLKLKMLRPFPTEIIQKILANTQKIAVLDRNCSFGLGGIFAQEIRACLCNLDKAPLVFSYISGLGGRDVTQSILKEIYWLTKKNQNPKYESIWVGLDKNNLSKID